MKKFSAKTLGADLFFITAGTGCMALAIQWFYEPGGFVTGGFTGIAIMVRQRSLGFFDGGIPLWLTNLVLNIPVFLAAWKIKGKQFVGKTGYATILLSVWLYLIPGMDMAQNDMILAAVFGGALSGAGIGMVFLVKASTGGTDMTAILVQHKLKHYSIIRILQMIDGAVVAAGMCAFGLKSGLYALIAIFITSKVSDALIEGMKYSKAAFIITDQHEAVSKALMEQLNRGVTGLYAKGMYSGDGKCMLYCVVSRKEIIDLKEIVVGIDHRAFVIVSDAREVLGEGFIEGKF